MPAGDSKDDGQAASSTLSFELVKPFQVFSGPATLRARAVVVVVAMSQPETGGS